MKSIIVSFETFCCFYHNVHRFLRIRKIVTFNKNLTTFNMPPKKKSKPDPDLKSTEKLVTEESSVDGASQSKRGRKKSSASQKDGKDPKVLQNQASTEFKAQDFENSSTTGEGKQWNLKIASWNVDGLRAWIKKGALEYIHHENPDILCLQETKCSESKLPQEIEVPGYHTYWSHSELDGYAGLGLYTKVKPISVSYGIGIPEFDKEGRLMIAEYEKFHVINVYVPNSGRKLVTLPKRLQWDPEFLKVIKDLDCKKPVIICGDMNVAHQEIDIANPKSNKRNAGFTQEERDGFSNLLKTANLIDCFRFKYPDTKSAYTFWTYMANARKKNIGWRLDYCLLSPNLASTLCDCIIRSQVFGSDHCPIALFLSI